MAAGQQTDELDRNKWPKTQHTHTLLGLDLSNALMVESSLMGAMSVGAKLTSSYHRVTDYEKPIFLFYWDTYS